MLEATLQLWEWLPAWLQILLKIGIIVLPLMGAVAYLTFAERKIIGFMQVRMGPNRVGPRGWLQPIADALKLMTKEVIVPTNANRFLFLIAPILTLTPALAAWAVIPFADGLVLADVDAALLYVLALTSMGVYGVIIAGWASNSKYAFLGALRSAAQIVAYEIAMGFALVGVLMAGGSLNLGKIVTAQSGVAVVRGVLHLRRGRNQSRAVRCRRRGVGNRRRFSRRVFWHGVRGVFPRRVREHDIDRGADRGAVHGRVAFSFLWQLAGCVEHDSRNRLDVRPRHTLVFRQNGVFPFLFSVVPGDVSPLPLRSDHAAGVESVSAHHDRMAVRRRHRNRRGLAALVGVGARSCSN
jgi:hypothetical protein